MKREREFLLRLDELFERNPFNSRCHIIGDCSVAFRPMAGGDVYLSELRAFAVGLGYGSRCMTTICELADRYRVTLRLQPQPLGPQGPNRRQLVAFYRRFGFCKRMISSEMYRSPQPERKQIVNSTD